MLVSLAELLEHYAAWVGGVEPRGARWVERLEANAAELEAIRALPASSLPVYVAQQTAIAPPVGDVAPAALPVSGSPGDIAAALQRAREANPQLKALSAFADFIEAGKPGYLRDVPFVVKDMIAVAGMPLTGGSASGDPAPAVADAACVAALRRHGAVPIAMANQDELAMGASGSSPLYGEIANPSAPGHTPGGSSGGSAASVAAGLVRFALGTDTGGSIRLPAACCGVVGFKPTYDAVSRAGVIDLAPSLDHVGPLGLGVRDCALAFAAMLDLPAEPSWQLAALDGVRVGRLRGYFEEPIDVEVLAGVEEASTALCGAGASVASGHFEAAREASALYFVTALGEASATHADRLRLRGGDIGDSVRSRLETGHFIPAHWYINAQRHRTGLAREAAAMLKDFDILLSATMRVPAPKRGASIVEIDGVAYPLHALLSQLTIPFNLIGAPAISIPWSQTKAGVPIGVQLIAKPGDDWKLLAVAERLERVRNERGCRKPSRIA